MAQGGATLPPPIVIVEMRWVGDRDGRRLEWCDGNGVWRIIKTVTIEEAHETTPYQTE